MLATEQRKPRRKDIKTVEKDLKTLTTIFTDRRLFIKVHMIYKKFTTPQPTHPGALFYALANFYNILHTAHGCHKLLKNTMKVHFRSLVLPLLIIAIIVDGRVQRRVG